MKILTVTWYKLKMMFSDRLFFSAMVVLPLFITVATGYALRHEKLNIVPAAVVDEDHSDYSRLLQERLSKKEGLEIHVLSAGEALKMLKENKIEAVFIIKKGFQEKIAKEEPQQIIDMVKSPSSFSSSYIAEMVAGEVMRFAANHIAANRVVDRYRQLKKPVGDELVKEIIGYSDSQWEPKPLMTVDYREMEGDRAKKVRRASLPAATATSTGIIVVFIMFYILFSSGWLIEERRNGTLKRLLCGPDAMGCSYAGSILALLISGTAQVALFSTVNRIAFGVNLFPGIGSYAVLLAYLFSVIAISLFLASLLKTPAQLQAGAPVFALLTGFAGGCFWNFVEMPEEIKRISHWTLQGWALEGINRQLANPGDISGTIFPIMVLVMISLILIPLSYWLTLHAVKK